MVIAIIGLGSPQGCDQAGLLLIEMLNNTAAITTRGDVSLLACDRPGVSLLTTLHGFDRVVLLDALVSDLPVGQWNRYTLDQLRTVASLTSSHGFGVAETLALGAELGMLPDDLVLLGVSVGDGCLSREQLCDSLLRCLPWLVNELIDWINSPKSGI